MITKNLEFLQSEYNRLSILGNLNCYCFFFSKDDLVGIHSIRAVRELKLNKIDYDCYYYDELSIKQLRAVVNYLTSIQGENNGK